MTVQHDHPIGRAPAELRVHGVGGPQARKMLGELHEEDVVTVPAFCEAQVKLGEEGPTYQQVPADTQTRFARSVRPLDGVEAYEWGGLTTGSWTKALWIVYLPFTLINVAGWAHHAAEPTEDQPPRLVTAHLALVHAAAGLATMTYLGWIGYIVLDLIAVKWRRHVLEAGELTNWIAHDAVDAWLPVLAPILFAGILLALWYAPIRHGAFEADGPETAEPWPRVPDVRRAAFFRHRRSYDRLRVAHGVVGLVTAAAVIGQYLLRWDLLGVGLVLVAACSAIVLPLLCVVDAVGRHRNRWEELHGDPPGANVGGWRGPPWLPVGGAFAVVGTAMAQSAFAGLVLLLRPILANLPKESDVTAIPVNAELGASDVLAWALLLMVVGFGAVALVARSSVGGPGANDGTGLAVELSRRAVLLGTLAAGAILVPLGIYIGISVDQADPGLNPLRWPRALIDWHGDYDFNANSLLQRAGGAAMLALPGIIYGVLTRPHDSGIARVIGNVWDVLTFWPRRFHPFAAPASAERSVPELRARIRHTLKPERCIQVTGHSQGSVLALAAIAALPEDERARVHVVTFGSPAGALYCPTWPAYAPAMAAAVAQAGTREDGRPWVNFWRPTDPIGADVPFAVNRRLDPTQRPTPEELDGAADRKPLERRTRWGTRTAHSGYLAEPQVIAELAAGRCTGPAVGDERPGAAPERTTDADPAPDLLDRSGPPLLWAHQGGAREAPSNTRYALRRAARIPSMASELDVHVTRDGVLVLCHDRTLDRTTDGRGRIRRRTWAAVSRLDASVGWDLPAGTDRGELGVPRLRDVLDELPADRPVTIEVKARRAVPPLAELLAEPCYRGRRIVVTAFSGRTVRHARRLIDHPGGDVGFAPGAAASAWFRAKVALTPPPRTAHEAPAPIGSEPGQVPRPPYARLQIPDRLWGIPVATARVVAAAHARGMAVDVWTIDHLPTVDRLVAIHVDGIMTDRPTALHRHLTASGAPPDSSAGRAATDAVAGGAASLLATVRHALAEVWGRIRSACRVRRR